MSRCSRALAGAPLSLFVIAVPAAAQVSSAQPAARRRSRRWRSGEGHPGRRSARPTDLDRAARVVGQPGRRAVRRGQRLQHRRPDQIRARFLRADALHRRQQCGPRIPRHAFDAIRALARDGRRLRHLQLPRQFVQLPARLGDRQPQRSRAGRHRLRALFRALPGQFDGWYRQHHDAIPRPDRGVRQRAELLSAVRPIWLARGFVRIVDRGRHRDQAEGKRRSGRACRCGGW